MASPRKGETVSVPCRACGKEFIKVTVVEGALSLKCMSCGKTTMVKVKCKGDQCQVMTELAKGSG